jgi:hypothetical protein
MIIVTGTILLEGINCWKGRGITQSFHTFFESLSRVFMSLKINLFVQKALTNRGIPCEYAHNE